MSLPVHPLAGQRVARISAPRRTWTGQTDALTAAGCEKIFADTASGKLTERPELTLCRGYLRAGDTLVVWRLDRLGRRSGIWWDIRFCPPPLLGRPEGRGLPGAREGYR